MAKGEGINRNGNCIRPSIDIPVYEQAFSVVDYPLSTSFNDVVKKLIKLALQSTASESKK